MLNAVFTLLVTVDAIFTLSPSVLLADSAAFATPGANIGHQT